MTSSERPLTDTITRKRERKRPARQSKRPLNDPLTPKREHKMPARQSKRPLNDPLTPTTRTQDARPVKQTTLERSAYAQTPKQQAAPKSGDHDTAQKAAQKAARKAAQTAAQTAAQKAKEEELTQRDELEALQLIEVLVIELAMSGSANAMLIQLMSDVQREFNSSDIHKVEKIQYYNRIQDTLEKVTPSFVPPGSQTRSTSSPCKASLLSTSSRPHLRPTRPE